MCLASLSRRSSVAGAEELYVSAKLVSVGGVGEQVEWKSASGVEESKWSRRVQVEYKKSARKKKRISGTGGEPLPSVHHTPFLAQT